MDTDTAFVNPIRVRIATGAGYGDSANVDELLARGWIFMSYSSPDGAVSMDAPDGISRDAAVAILADMGIAVVTPAKVPERVERLPEYVPTPGEPAADW
jgi:hypothetical protein